MANPRTVASVMELPVHEGGIKPCITMVNAAIHTIEVDGKHFAALVLSRPDAGMGCVAILDREEFDAQSALFRNALEDADRPDAGLPTIHAAPSLARN